MTVAFQSTPYGDLTRPTMAGSRGLRFLVRLRFQLLGAALIGVLLPALIRTRLDLSWGFDGGSMQNTILATTAAMLLGAIILYRMTAYPGVWALSFVLPSFALSYLLTILIVFFARLEYSRFQFVFSFLLVVAWFYFVLNLKQRLRRPRLLLLPYGRSDRLAENGDAEWVVMPATMQLSLPFDGDAGAVRQSSLDWSNDGSPLKLPPGISGVVADLHADPPTHWEQFLARCVLRGVPVYHFKQISESLTGCVEIEHLSENNLGSLLPSSVYFRFKLWIDLAVAAAVAPLALPIGLAAAIAIKLDDGGRIFFRQTRTGHRGQVFTILKFRTMRHDAGPGEFFTEENDERVTRVGRFLRRYRIDELPQIINILRGEMSWIGPRPEALPLSRWYESKIPFYSYRHIVRPGISGWAQVNQGNVAKIAAATDKLHYDFFYIKNFSPWLDLLISAKTIRIILTGFGAR